jgi:hypothetical protein
MQATEFFSAFSANQSNQSDTPTHNPKSESEFEMPSGQKLDHPCTSNTKLFAKASGSSGHFLHG